MAGIQVFFRKTRQTNGLTIEKNLENTKDEGAGILSSGMFGLNSLCVTLLDSVSELHGSSEK